MIKRAIQVFYYRMISLIGRIFHFKINPSYNGSSSRHLKRLISGPKVLIDGKVYIKVKLRFVDTLDFNTTRYIDRIETELESQKHEIERLSELISKNDKLINDLQALNVNLIHEIKYTPERLSEQVSTLTNENNQKKKIVADTLEECRKLKEKLYHLNGQVIKLQNEITLKNNTIKSLELTLAWLKKSDKGIISLLESNNKIKNEMKLTEDRLRSALRESKRKDSVIEDLTKRILEYEQVIYRLETLAKDK